MMEVTNAQINQADLGYVRDGSLFGFVLGFDYGSFGQGWPIALGSPETNITDPFIRNVLPVVGIDFWHEMKGKYVRVVRNFRVVGIAHITNDRKALWIDQEGKVQTGTLEELIAHAERIEDHG